MRPSPTRSPRASCARISFGNPRRGIQNIDKQPISAPGGTPNQHGQESSSSHDEWVAARRLSIRDARRTTQMAGPALFRLVPGPATVAGWRRQRRQILILARRPRASAVLAPKYRHKKPNIYCFFPRPLCVSGSPTCSTGSSPVRLWLQKTHFVASHPFVRCRQPPPQTHFLNDSVHCFSSFHLTFRRQVVRGCVETSARDRQVTRTSPSQRQHRPAWPPPRNPSAILLLFLSFKPQSSLFVAR